MNALDRFISVIVEWAMGHDDFHEALCDVLNIQSLSTRPVDEVSNPAIPYVEGKTMSLEEALAKNTAALEANTAALLKGGGKPAASGGGASAYKPKHTYDEMTAALGELKEKSGGSDVPKEIIKTVGKADKMKDITDPALIDAVYDECKAKVKALGDADM